MYYVNVCGYACFVRNHGIKRTLNSWQSFDCSSIVLIFLYNRLINRPLITEGYEFRRKNSEWIRSRHLSPHSRMWKTSIIVRWLYKTLEKLKISLDKIAFIQSLCNWNYNNLLLCLMWIFVKKKKKNFFLPRIIYLTRFYYPSNAQRWGTFHFFWQRFRHVLQLLTRWHHHGFYY